MRDAYDYGQGEEEWIDELCVCRSEGSLFELDRSVALANSGSAVGRDSSCVQASTHGLFRWTNLELSTCWAATNPRVVARTQLTAIPADFRVRCS